MTDQPYQGGPYEGYDPYQQQDWPGQEPRYGQQPGHDAELTQQWQGQTWETQTHAPVQAAETAYLPRQEEQPYRQPHYQDPQYQQAHQPQARYGHQQQAPMQHHQPQQAQQSLGPHGQEAYGQDAYPHDAYDQNPHAHGHHPQDAYAQEPHAHGSYAAEPYASGAQPAPAPGPAVSASASASAQVPAADPVAGQAPEAVAEPAGDSAGPAYGPATLAGNARITDAQRARLEGRSPIIEPGLQPAALTALLGLLLAAAAPIASYALAVPLVVLQAVTAAGWFRLNGMWPARQGIALAFAGALTADVAVLAAGRDHALVAILGSLGLWVLLSLVLQLRSHASPDERMYGLMATIASAALAVLATGFLAADPHAVSVGAAAVAVAVLARALPMPAPASVVVSLLAAAGAGIAVGGMTGYDTKGAALGAAAGVCALIGHRVASYDYPSRFVHFTAGVALPLSAAAPMVWALGRALG
ncbi:hypothetical protein JK361_33755 [Streptomyces sp. 5-8]|uniref:Integral membrane protein n=1 Tax=Streptomyces musisoli TaxID=2802280 RepID=A0ABS1PAT9_9ACTN|nr:hypothetical protein [Streptomyces musisoli]MBL1109489.1 hypothetical protein [Streptomyces musisoli]